MNGSFALLLNDIDDITWWLMVSLTSIVFSLLNIVSKLRSRFTSACLAVELSRVIEWHYFQKVSYSFEHFIMCSLYINVIYNSIYAIQI